MNHFLMIVLFAALVSIVFGVIGKEGHLEQIRYGSGVFAKFVGIAFVLGWVLYFLPR